MAKGLPNLPAQERLIVALDLPPDQALALAAELKSTVKIFKVGLQLVVSPGGLGILDRLGELGVQVFLDLKMWDIPETVGRALQAIQTSHPHIVLATVHTFNRGLEHALQATKAAARLKVLVVTLLTSMDAADLAALGIAKTVDQFVMDEARRAAAAGCNGLIASGLEAPQIRKAFPEMLIVTPGIRPAWAAVKGEDQKRITTPAEAIHNGADYIVVGRPIYQNPPPGGPREAVRRIQEEIEAAVRDRLAGSGSVAHGPSGKLAAG